MSPRDPALVSDIVRASLARYVEKGVPVGGFLEAVLTNNLSRACASADNENLAALPAIVSYIFNELPGDCWGSEAMYAAWLNRFAERERKAVRR